MRGEPLPVFLLGSCFCIASATLGCGPSNGFYRAGLERIDRGPEQIEKRIEQDWAEPFEDERIRIEFKLTRKWVEFRLKNRTEEPARIRWSRVSLDTPDGRKSEIVHLRKIDPTDRELTTPGEKLSPSVVESGYYWSDIVAPEENLRKKFLQGWALDPFLPKHYRDARHLEGERLSLTLPLTFGEGDEAVTVNYEFHLRIWEVEEGPRSIRETVENPGIGPPR